MKKPEIKQTNADDDHLLLGRRRFIKKLAVLAGLAAIVGGKRSLASSAPIVTQYPTILIASKTWAIHSAHKDYSVIVDNPANATALRFEVRDGDVAAIDVGRHPVRTRSEIISPDRFNHGQDLWWAFGQKLTGALPFVPTESGVLMHYIFSQWHTNDASPAWQISPFLSFELDKNGVFYVRTRGSNTPGHSGNQIDAITIPDFQMGRWYDYVVHMIPSPTNAVLEIWRNGEKIVDIQAVQGKSIGYAGDVDFYQKHGEYFTNISNTVVAEYRNIVNPSTTSLDNMVAECEVPILPSQQDVSEISRYCVSKPVPSQ